MQTDRYPNQPDGASGESAGRVYALPTGQLPIVQSDTTVVDLIGVTVNAGGDLYIKMQKDSDFTKNVVVAGQTVMGRIIGVGASTTILDADLIGLI
jgi:hypothetical protein